MEKNTFKKIYSYLPFILLFGIFLLIHKNFGLMSDDIFFNEMIVREGYHNILNYLFHRYSEWTSRVIIEFNLLTLAYLPLKVWKFLDSIFLVLIGIITMKFFTNTYSFKNKDLINGVLSSILVLLFFYVSYGEIINCGGISVSLNYFWPFLFILLHFYILKEYVFKKKIESNYKKAIIYFLLIFSLIYACNHEQGLMIFVILYGLLISYCLYKKEKISRTLYLMIFLILLEGIFIYLTPGNQVRFIVEYRWFPEYANFSLFNKIDLGFTSFFRLFLVENNVVCLLFLFVFGIYNYLISKNLKIGIISSIPFIVCFISNLSIILGFGEIMAIFVAGNTTSGLFVSELPYIIFFTALYLILIFCIFYGIYQIKKYKGNKIAFTIFILLALGFITSFTAGFTPTIWASRLRMFIFLYGFLNLSTYLLLTDLINGKLNEEKT